jgi:ABC-type multidrug transport system permease subunit
MWSSIVAITRKEILHIQRDRFVVRTVLLMQLIQVLLLGFMDTTVRHLPTVIVDQDRSSFSREFTAQIQATTTFEITHNATSLQEARGLIRSGRCRVGVLLPPDFRTKRAARSGASILLLVDGSDATASANAIAAINGLVARANVEELSATSSRVLSTEPPLSANSITLFNPEGRTPNYMLPGLIAIVLQWFVNMVASALSRERENGTLERLLMTPLDVMGFMIGKAIPYVVFAFLNFLLVLTVMRWLFGVEIRGSIPLLLLSGFVYLLAVLSLGLFVGSNARSGQEVTLKATLLTIPAIFLSGYIFPTSGLPPILYWLAQAMPQTHFVELSRALILRSAEFRDLLVHLGALLLITTLMMVLAVRRFRVATGG